MVMKRVWWLLIPLLAAGCFSKEFTMEPAAEVAAVPGPGAFYPQIIGGEAATPTEWPATLVFSRGPCTGTAVGRYVVLVAAHCLEYGTSGKVEGPGGATTHAVCAQHPTYVKLKSTHPQWEQLTSADFALCELTHPLDQILPGVEYEHVNLDPAAYQLGDLLHLIGFGCTQLNGSTFMGLYEGDAEVTRLPPTNGFFTFTEDDVALCEGDSGGGAYLVQGDDRRLVAVNSHGDKVQARLSALATTGVGGFGDWARKWASERHVKICGVHADAQGCRSP